ncbi:hypothetical protein OCF84_21885 (plasmid) [Shewanella xiamenensis]|jgi:hypothetical protein|uniref:hypothetical protein n=1 Tax=Shewanella TaxID=22 RepID=UPI00112EC3C7|nr:MULTISPECIES: hypothetical protein [Shewanella]QQK62494.1 hypothetical protein FJD32_024275 [Shewanella sp. LC6]TPE56178.1 hypothetical protein FJD33_14805 [Shewanella sp. LC2]WHF58053.1 hypothetical protein OCF84_21885 [Shewanella xiamenensis]
MSDKSKVIAQQAKMVKEQVEIILRNYELSDADKDKISTDIADVILSGWDLKLNDLLFPNPNQK